MRPTSVTVVAWWAIVWYALVLGLHLAKLVRLNSLEIVAAYEVVASATRIFFARGILRRNNDARVGFLATYALCAIVLDALAYWPDWPELIVNYVFNLFLLVIFAVVLSQRSVVEWFGATNPDMRRGPEVVFDAIHRWAQPYRDASLRSLGTLFMTVSLVIFLFFGWHVWRDVLTLVHYEESQAEIISAGVRDASVNQVRSRDTRPARPPSSTTTVIVTYDPEIVYRYRAGGRVMTSDTFSSFGTTLGAIANPARVRARFTPGSIHRCWYDPSHPERAVLQRGISPYYAFTFFNLILFMFGRVMRRSRRMA